MAISPVATLTTPTANTSTVPNPKQALGQSDFLKLLVTQMMQSGIASMQANNLIGRTVIVNSSNGTLATGVISAVQMQAGTPEIIVNGQSYGLGDITSILPAP